VYLPNIPDADFRGELMFGSEDLPITEIMQKTVDEMKFFKKSLKFHKRKEESKRVRPHLKENNNTNKNCQLES
jgi:hypothetical protein